MKLPIALSVILAALLPGAAVAPALAKDKPLPRLIVGASANPKSSSDGTQQKQISDGPGPLRITYTDGSMETVPADKDPGLKDVDHLVQGFSDVTISPDRKTIAWDLVYSGVCAQNYPCPVEVDLYRSGHPLLRIFPIYGDLWSWSFLSNGEQVATLSGFPHGDDIGEAALYDTATGHQLATFKGEGEKPAWVEQAFPNQAYAH